MNQCTITESLIIRFLYLNKYCHIKLQALKKIPGKIRNTFQGYYLKVDCIVLPCLVCLCKGATEGETRKQYTGTAYAQETQVIHLSSLHGNVHIYSYRLKHIFH